MEQEIHFSKIPKHKPSVLQVDIQIVQFGPKIQYRHKFKLIIVDLTKHVTILVNEEESELMVETANTQDSEYDLEVYKVPKDDEYWVSNSHGSGIKKATSFFHTQRGEEWLINKLEEVAEEYPSIETPNDLSDITWWKSSFN